MSSQTAVAVRSPRRSVEHPFLQNPEEQLLVIPSDLHNGQFVLFGQKMLDEGEDVASQQYRYGRFNWLYSVVGTPKVNWNELRHPE